MEDLPYIDEHSLAIAAAPSDVWRALLSVLAREVGGVPRPVKALLGVQPSELRGDWMGTLRVGDSMPGFSVSECVVASRLALRGQHRFSRYALVFVLDGDGASCTLRAQSWGAFPGLKGRGYRALVIGSGGHRVAVRRMLRSVARRAGVKR